MLLYGSLQALQVCLQLIPAAPQLHHHWLHTQHNTAMAEVAPQLMRVALIVDVITYSVPNTVHNVTPNFMPGRTGTYEMVGLKVSWLLQQAVL
jgi:hypothetical protein